MTKLIDKTAAYNALKHEAETHELSFSAEAYDRAARIIDQMPTIEAEPVRHGRWIVRGQEIYCSECNEESLYNPFGASKFSRFCPNCGADMQEVSEDAGSKID